VGILTGVNRPSQFHNRIELQQIRRQLRASLTPAEARLWTHLQRSQLSGRKFRRQHGAGPYVLDFYCPRVRLAVELDGAAHDHAAAQGRDARRDAFLSQARIRVLRFENRDVMDNLEGVLAVIREALDHPAA
jgi:very-short-patch-repair endonuclease